MVGSVENVMPWELIVLSYYHLILFIKDLPIVPVAFSFHQGLTLDRNKLWCLFYDVEGSRDSEQSGILFRNVLVANKGTNVVECSGSII